MQGGAHHNLRGAVNMSLHQREETLKIPELLQDDGASELLAFRRELLTCHKDPQAFLLPSFWMLSLKDESRTTSDDWLLEPLTPPPFVSWGLQCINVKLREVIFLETIYACKEYCGSIILDKTRVCCEFLLVSGTMGTSHTHLSCGHCTQTCLERVSIMMPKPGSTHCLQAAVLDTSHQTARPEHSPACQQRGCLKPYEAHRHPKHTPVVALPIRGKSLSTTRQAVGTSPSHSEDSTSSWTNLTQEGADNRSKRNWPQTVIQAKWEDREVRCRWSCKVKTHKSK